MCYNLGILTIRQLDRCRITATSFWIQTTSSCPRLRPLTNKSTFLPSPSLGSWNHTALPQFLTDFCFQLYFITLLPILKRFLIDLRAPRLLRGLAFPLEPQELLRHSTHLWQVHFFAAQCTLSRTCFVSGWAPGKAVKGWHYSQLTAGNREFCSSLSLLDLQSASPAPSFAKRIAAPGIFWQEGWQEIQTCLH